MKTYDGLNYSMGEHTIRVSLQANKYTGSFTHTIAGNCKGAGVLDFNIEDYDQEDIASFVKIGCTIKRLEEDDTWLRVVLTDSTGDTCESEIQDDEFMRMVVGIEIVDFVKEG